MTKPGHDPNVDPSRIDRREFCAHACQTLSVAALAGAIGAVLDGCGGSPTAPSNVPALPILTATQTGGATTLTIDAGSALAAVGSMALVQSALGPLLVAHTGDGAFSAVTGTCTHEACTITGRQGQNYVCPCHGSEFDATGRVLNGPAPTSLRRLQTQFANDVLTITA
jgi:cytochrome b6-f complex iron-sulfur subunit